MHALTIIEQSFIPYKVYERLAPTTNDVYPCAPIYFVYKSDKSSSHSDIFTLEDSQDLKSNII